jgi:hypothetical protein
MLQAGNACTRHNAVNIHYIAMYGVNNSHLFVIDATNIVAEALKGYIPSDRISVGELLEAAVNGIQNTLNIVILKKK